MVNLNNAAFEELIAQKFLHPVDFFFAKRLCPEKPSLFLAYLLAKAREGHLCVSVENNTLYPSLGKEWDTLLCEEAEQIPVSIFDKWITRQGNRYYLKRHFDYETRFVKAWNRLKLEMPSHILSSEWLTDQMQQLSLEPEQQEAILKTAKNTLTVISGGPGTGKTYTAACLIRLFSQAGIEKIAVAAPTGKAASNLRSALADQVNVETLHSLLKKRHLSADLILVDEGSMIDAAMMASLFEAVKEGARLILLGDKDQLPPVASGHFFIDLANDSAHTAELKTCLRAELSEIIDLAKKVKEGASVPFHPISSLREMVELFSTMIPFNLGMGQEIEEWYKNFRILCPLRQGPFGVDELNRLLFEQHMRRAKKNIPIPIMVTVNDSSVGLSNGDTGFLVKEDKAAYFPGGKRVPEYLLPHYEYAYVLSVHKSQGSEYGSVMVLLPKGSEVFGREMLYTAVTRAKKSVTIFTDETTLAAVLNKQSFRFSGI